MENCKIKPSLADRIEYESTWALTPSGCTSVISRWSTSLAYGWTLGGTTLYHSQLPRGVSWENSTTTVLDNFMSKIDCLFKSDSAEKKIWEQLHTGDLPLYDMRISLIIIHIAWNHVRTIISSVFKLAVILCLLSLLNMSMSSAFDSLRI